MTAYNREFLYQYLCDYFYDISPIFYLIVHDFNLDPFANILKNTLHGRYPEYSEFEKVFKKKY